jgi:citronellyl-CoA synthetase
MVAHPHYLLKGDHQHYAVFDSKAIHYNSAEPWIPFRIKAADAAMYIFTSGTSGLPKASVISHGRWVKAYSAFGLTLLRLNPEDILYVPLPFYHATAMVVCWSSVVAGGASVVMKNKFSVSEFWPDVHKYQVTGFGYVGELCKYLLSAPVHPLEKNTSLKKMIGNGLRSGIWQQFKERFGIEQVCEFYASSEGNIAFFNVFNIDNTMGFTITSYAIVEYDKDNGKPVLDKNGHMIKVQPGGTGLLLGEINERYPFDGYTDPAKTEAVTFRNVFTKGDAWFNTGDLVRDMGYFHTQFVDRLGDTFRWKSENVSTTEVEDIINNFPGINESVVYGVEIPDTIGRAGMAQLILEESVDSINLKDFYDFVSRELPPYAVPVFLRIANNTEMTSTFKYKKSTLKEEAYNCNILSDTLYVLLDKHYVLLTPEIKKGLDKGEFRL